MALTEQEQIKREVERSRHILLTFPRDFSTDALASTLALYLVLQKMGKKVDMVCDGFTLPKNLHFLPETAAIQATLTNLQKFIINLDLTKDGIQELSYNVEGEQLKIYITPKRGAFTKEDVSAEHSDYRYDLIFCLSSSDLEGLGKAYRQATDFFYKTTIINIDHNPANDQFGQINVTDPNAVATAELLFTVINGLGANLVTKEVATCLLTGLIAETRSFKTINVTPTTLEVAGELLEADADREAIIKALYRSRSISTLNLWGRALTRLKSSGNGKMVWSTLTEADFIEAGARTSDLTDIIDELIGTTPGVEVVAIFFQRGATINVLLQTLKNHNALFLARPYLAEGHKRTVRFKLEGKTLQDAETEVTAALLERLGKE